MYSIGHRLSVCIADTEDNRDHFLCPKQKILEAKSTQRARAISEPMHSKEGLTLQCQVFDLVHRHLGRNKSVWIPV